MERTKAINVESGKIRYKKYGGGSLRLNIGGKNRIIKQGETFSALPNEIPEAFKDTIIPVDPIQATRVEEVHKPIPAEVIFKAVPRGKSKSLFDIVDGQGKVMNDKPLLKEAAEQFVKDLSK